MNLEETAFRLPDGEDRNAHTDSSSFMGTTLSCIPIPALADNYIWLIRNETHAAVIDPGEWEQVHAYLSENELDLAAVLLTHHHADHVGGVSGLLRTTTTRGAIPVFGPNNSSLTFVNRPVQNGDRLSIGELGMTVEVIGVPGHTLDHLAYYQAAASLIGTSLPRVFSGDTLFATGCGRVFEGTSKQMLDSLDALASLPDETQLYCAHEYTLSNIRFALACDPDNSDLKAWHTRATRFREQGMPTLPTTIGHEKRVNPFLRTDVSAIRSTLNETLHVDVRDRLETFLALRKWKDRF